MPVADKEPIRILERGSRRVLTYRGTIYSILDRESRYTRTYHDYFLPLPGLFHRSRVLVIGLGGGAIPSLLKDIYRDRIEVDVVDPDRSMIAAARDFLSVKRFNFRVIATDGLSYLKRCRKRYDVIIMDAFVRDRIPREFFSREFIDIANAALTDRGILGINYAPNYIFMFLYLHRLRKRFKTYRIRHIKFGNYIILCSKYFDNKQIRNAVRAQLGGEKDGRFVLRRYDGLR